MKSRDTFDNDSAVGLGAPQRDNHNRVRDWDAEGTATLDLGAGNGTATFTNLRIDTAGAKTLQATSAGKPNAVERDEQLVHGESWSSIHAGLHDEPGSATAGAAFGQQPVVKTRDAFGNDSTVGLGASRNVTITIASGTGPLQGTATLDIGTGAGNGTVTFTNLRIDAAGAKTPSSRRRDSRQSDAVELPPATDHLSCSDGIHAGVFDAARLGDRRRCVRSTAGREDPRCLRQRLDRRLGRHAKRNYYDRIRNRAIAGYGDTEHRHQRR